MKLASTVALRSRRGKKQRGPQGSATAARRSARGAPSDSEASEESSVPPKKGTATVNNPYLSPAKKSTSSNKRTARSSPGWETPPAASSKGRSKEIDLTNSGTTLDSEEDGGGKETPEPRVIDFSGKGAEDWARELSDVEELEENASVANNSMLDSVEGGGAAGAPRKAKGKARFDDASNRYHLFGQELDDDDEEDSWETATDEDVEEVYNDSDEETTQSERAMGLGGKGKGMKQGSNKSPAVEMAKAAAKKGKKGGASYASGFTDPASVPPVGRKKGDDMEVEKEVEKEGDDVPGLAPPDADSDDEPEDDDVPSLGQTTTSGGTTPSTGSAPRSTSNRVSMDGSTLTTDSSASRMINRRPQRVGDYSDLLTLTVRHRDDPDQQTSLTDRAHAAAKFTLEMILRVDKDAELLPIYDDLDEGDAQLANAPKPIKDSKQFPKDWMDCGNHLQCGNGWSLNKVFGKTKDGQPKQQPHSFINMKLHTHLDLDHILSLISGKLDERKLSLRKKDFPFLDTKTFWAFLGTINDWCPAEMTEVCHEELSKMEEWMQANQKKNLQYAGEPFPPLMIRRTYLKLPDSKGLISEADSEFIEYFASLRNVLAVELAQSDYARVKPVMDQFVNSGACKRAISKHAHVKELKHGNMAKQDKIVFLKEIKLQMTYNHRYSATTLFGFQTLNHKFRVEMASGKKAPRKTSTLRRELLNLCRKDGTKPILGVHEVWSGPNKGGVMVLHHLNDANEAFFSALSGGIGAWLYRYMLHELGFSTRCVVNALTGMEDSERLSAADSHWDSSTFTVKTLKTNAAAEFMNCMMELDLGTVPEELQKEARAASAKKKFSDKAMERVAKAMGLRDVADGQSVHFSAVNSRASVLTNGTHQTDGQQTYRSVTSTDVGLKLPSMREDLNRLKLRLRELSPDDTLFASLSALKDDPLESMSLGSSASAELANLFKVTKDALGKLRARIAELEPGGPDPSRSASSSLPTASAATSAGCERAQGP